MELFHGYFVISISMTLCLPQKQLDFQENQVNVSLQIAFRTGFETQGFLNQADLENIGLQSCSHMRFNPNFTPVPASKRRKTEGLLGNSKTVLGRESKLFARAQQFSH